MALPPPHKSPPPNFGCKVHDRARAEHAAQEAAKSLYSGERHHHGPWVPPPVPGIANNNSPSSPAQLVAALSPEPNELQCPPCELNLPRGADCPPCEVPVYTSMPTAPPAFSGAPVAGPPPGYVASPPPGYAAPWTPSYSAGAPPPVAAPRVAPPPPPPAMSAPPMQAANNANTQGLPPKQADLVRMSFRTANDFAARPPVRR